jgi:hypothetical protein
MHHATPKLDEEISEINDYLIVGLGNCVLKILSYQKIQEISFNKND